MYKQCDGNVKYKNIMNEKGSHNEIFSISSLQNTILGTRYGIILKIRVVSPQSSLPRQLSGHHYSSLFGIMLFPLELFKKFAYTITTEAVFCPVKPFKE